MLLLFGKAVKTACVKIVLVISPLIFIFLSVSLVFYRSRNSVDSDLQHLFVRRSDYYRTAARYSRVGILHQSRKHFFLFGYLFVIYRYQISRRLQSQLYILTLVVGFYTVEKYMIEITLQFERGSVNTGVQRGEIDVLAGRNKVGSRLLPSTYLAFHQFEIRIYCADLLKIIVTVDRFKLGKRRTYRVLALKIIDMRSSNRVDYIVVIVARFEMTVYLRVL